ncbi:MAG: DUF115 domain-containing protein, partial [Clostridia bacterium]|nr:DUF115 domain-containing protein [Clostridia bacterium]
YTHNIDNHFKIDTQKKCAILAAGPTLDYKIEYLIQNRNKYFILSTDTAYKAATLKNLKCDAVITLDAQNISVNHFIHKKDCNTQFFLDYSSSPSIGRALKKNKNKTAFFTSGHPLENIITTSDTSLYLTSGSGTVTIAALDLAVKSGFNEIEVYGADFSYPFYKPYCKGTYLDIIYNKNSTKLCTNEKNFSKLMFRTELKKQGNISTTETLIAYKESFEKYLEENKLEYYLKQNVYVIKNNYENIIKEFSYDLISKKTLFDKITNRDQKMLNACLPYIAFCRRKNPEKDWDFLENQAFNDLGRFFRL